jgi:GTP cyclohydrolase I
MFTAYNRELCGESVTVSDINLCIVCDNHLVCSKLYNIGYMRNIKIIELTLRVEQITTLFSPCIRRKWRSNIQVSTVECIH